MKSQYKISALIVVLLLSACATVISMPDAAKDLANFKDSFAERGIAKLDRLEQSDLQKNCSDYAQTDMPADVRARLEKSELEAVKFPDDGKYLGDWKEGEKIAQNGRGLQFSDDAKTVNGGNCYACHQISKTEIAFGNIGPSLAEYGKLRGGPTEEIVKYTWTKLFSSHAYNACSVMPRYGAAGILTETQMKDVMALLLDPKSPINQ